EMKRVEDSVVRAEVADTVHDRGSVEFDVSSRRTLPQHLSGAGFQGVGRQLPRGGVNDAIRSNSFAGIATHVERPLLRTSHGVDRVELPRHEGAHIDVSVSYHRGGIDAPESGRPPHLRPRPRLEGTNASSTATHGDYPAAHRCR